jgi:hypothetical protein
LAFKTIKVYWQQIWDATERHLQFSISNFATKIQTKIWQQQQFGPLIIIKSPVKMIF